MQNFADRLIAAIQRKRTPAVVALDPVFASLPPKLRETADATTARGQLAAVMKYSRQMIELIAPYVPVVKINSAYFEVYHGPGIDAYHELVRCAAEHELVVIGDVKRGDVGHTAEMYAAAQLADPDMSEDATSHGAQPPSAVVLEDATPLAVTVSGYFGLDGVKPFIDIAVSQGKGLFVLVRTSNPSAAAIQDVPLADGRKLHEQVAAEVARWAGDPRTQGTCGYSCVGAVVATRNPADAAKLRAAMPRCFLLVPGYGAQGGTAEDFRPYFNRDGLGALVVAGRSVIFAYDRPDYRTAASWEDAVKAACQDFVRDLARVVAPI